MSVNASFSYEYTIDKITPYRTLLDSTHNIIEHTFINLGWDQQWYANLALRYPITNRWNVQLSGSSDWNESHASSKSTIYQLWDNRFTTEYSWKKWQISGSAGYSQTEYFQISGSGIWDYNVGVRYAIPQWDFLFSCNNFIPYYRINETNINGEGYQSYRQTKTRQFNTSVSIVYRFGKAKSSRQGAKDIKVDDM